MVASSSYKDSMTALNTLIPALKKEMSVLKETLGVMGRLQNIKIEKEGESRYDEELPEFDGAARGGVSED